MTKERKEGKKTGQVQRSKCVTEGHETNHNTYKLVETSASLLVTSALLVVTRSY